MTLRVRTCRSREDVMAVRQFLVQSEALLHTLANWDPRRWEGFCFYRDDAGLAATQELIQRDVAMAFRGDELVGAVIPEGPGNVHLQCMPNDEESEEVLLLWAIEHLAQVRESGTRWIEVWAYDDDLARRERLHTHGFAESSEFESVRSRAMSGAIPEVDSPTGYVVRGYRDSDAAALAQLLNESFGRTYHSAQEYLNFARNAVDHVDDLEIIIEAPDGSIAANAGFNIFPAGSFGVVEPVSTHPRHQGQGLAQVAIEEGLRRVSALGIHRMYIGAWHANPVSNHVYEAMGFTDARNLRMWRKEF